MFIHFPMHIPNKPLFPVKGKEEKRWGFILRGNVDWMGREEETMSFVVSGPACIVKARHLGSDGAPLFFFSYQFDTFPAPSHLSFFPPRSIILIACAVLGWPSPALHGSQDRQVYYWPPCGVSAVPIARSECGLVGKLTVQTHLCLCMCMMAH